MPVFPQMGWQVLSLLPAKDAPKTQVLQRDKGVHLMPIKGYRVLSVRDELYNKLTVYSREHDVPIAKIFRLILREREEMREFAEKIDVWPEFN